MNPQLRSQFPSLSRQHNGQPLIYLDGPGGTQVPNRVIDAISHYYENSNANAHGFFPTTIETDQVIDTARQKMADLLGAAGPHTISFGQNMTSLCYALSRAIGKYLQKGDEILITQLDHEANRGPWLALRDQGIVVREVNLLPNGILDYDDFRQKLNERTRLVAMGASSNIIGTVNDFHLVRQLTHQYGAWLLLDAVHYVPHYVIDVQAMDCDFLLCSAYKFYGPHVGILYSRPNLLDQLPTYSLRTAPQQAPYSIETGTLNHAALAGVSAAVDFIASIGDGDNQRKRIVSAMNQLSDHERDLLQNLFSGLRQIPNIQVIGTEVVDGQRAPTLSFLAKGMTASQICKALAEKAICAWAGHFYALRSVEVLGLLAGGGVTRFGLSAYNTAEEVDRVLEVVDQIVSSNKVYTV